MDMMRDIVRIDEDKCTGCGACAEACVEGAIKMVDGKARLISEAHCDGLGACLPSCPADAISIEKRDAAPFAEPAPAKNDVPMGGIPMTACPGSGPRRIVHDEAPAASEAPSRLSQWPVQLRLVPVAAPYLEDCDLLIAADCSAYACGSFHEKFIKGKITLIGCPKLDPQDCWDKIRDIVSMHHIRSITVTRMDVPCCSALVYSVCNAIESAGKDIPLSVYIIHADGKVEQKQ